jgi:hypothetical protein
MLVAALAVVAGCAAVARAQGDYHTVLQSAVAWDPKCDLGVDAVLLASDESMDGHNGLPGTAERAASWRGRGYRIFGFASVARVYRCYMDGGWRDLDGRADPGGHDGEVQRDRFGAKFGPHEFMLMPSASLTAHKKLWAKAFVDARAEGVAFEEPDIFMSGGYNESFKREWCQHYGEPWQPPHASIGARVKAEKLKAWLGYLGYRDLSTYSKEVGGPDFGFMVATHSLPNYMLWGVTFDFYNTCALPTVDNINAQVWTGTAKTPVLYEGDLREMLFENAFVDYSFMANLGEALGKPVWFSMDPYEDDPSLAFDFYKRGFEATLAASLAFPSVTRWNILPWPNRIYTNDRIPPDYGTELQNVVAAMGEMGAAGGGSWASEFPRTGVLFSETALQEMRDPRPGNPQTLFAMALPLLSMGVPVDIVPLEAAENEAYLDRFKVLVVSYDICKPSKAEYHAALLRWVRRGGILLVLGGMSAYNDQPQWWREGGGASPTACLLRDAGLIRGGGDLLPQRPAGISYAGKGPMADLLRGLYDGLRGADHRPRPVSFAADGGWPESNYLWTAVEPGRVRKAVKLDGGQMRDFRFCDGPGYFEYKFDLRGLSRMRVQAEVTHNYIIEASADGAAWAALANSFATGAREVRDESNRTTVTLDLSPWIGGGTVFLRFRDPSPQDGWGPLLLRMTLQPEGRDDRAPWPPDAPLALRDEYCIAYGRPAAGAEVFVAGEDGLAVALAAPCGAGRVMAIGAPPVLLASSKAESDVLRGVYRQLCADAGLKLAVDGVLHLVRGRVHIVYPADKPVRLKGTYLRVLSAEQEIVRDPVVSRQSPEVLVDTRTSGTHKSGLGLVFSSARLREEKALADGLEVVVSGPERIPGAVTVSLGSATSATVAAHRLSEGTAVETTATLDGSGGFARVAFPNHPDGVRLRMVRGAP